MKIQSKDIVKDTDSFIREKSAKVATPLSKEDKELALSMLDHVKRSQDPEIAEAEGIRPAVGIAAVQIGILKQILAISIPYEDEENEDFLLANPRIVSESVQMTYLKGGEGCLSVENEHEGYVPRHARIKVRAYDILQECDVEIKASGYTAIVLQHEIDHFSGKLFYDHINVNEPWKEIDGAEVIE